MKHVCAVLFKMFVVVAMVAVPGFAGEETKAPDISPQLKQSLQDYEANGKQLTPLLEKTLTAMKELLTTVQPDQANPEEVRQQIEKTVTPFLVAFEITTVQSFLAILEKSVTGPTDPRLPMAIELLSQYFSVPSKDVRTWYSEKQIPFSTINLGLCIAMVSNKPAAKIFEQYGRSKSWAEIAIDNGLKPGQLQKAAEAFLTFAMMKQ